MGRVIANKIQGMNLWVKVGLVTTLTLLVSVFMYQGWYKPMQATAAISPVTAWTFINDTNPNTLTPNVTSASTYTAGGTAGIGRVMLIAVSFSTVTTSVTMTGSNNSITASYGGVSATKLIGGDNGATAGRGVVWLGYIKDANIPAGANSVVVTGTVTGTNVTDVKIACATFSGVDQTTPFTDSKWSQTTAAATTGTAVSLNYNANDYPIIFANDNVASSTGSVTYTPAKYTTSATSSTASGGAVCANITTIPGANVTAESTNITATSGRIGLIAASLKVQTIVNPTVTSTTPNALQIGDTADVTITGTGFQSGATASFGAGITLNSASFNSATSLTANITVTATTGARNVTVTNPDTGAGTGTGVFTVNAAPTVTSTSPNSRTQGLTNQNVTITGTGFSNTPTAPTVVFSGTGITVNSVTYTNATTLTANIDVAANATAAARNVTVSNARGSAGTGTGVFTVTAAPAPTVTSANPNNAGQATNNLNVTINGTNFLSGAATAFSGTGITVNSTTYVSATQLTANITVATGAATGLRNVTVTLPGAQTGTGNNVFTVNAGTCSVTAPTVTLSANATVTKGQQTSYTLSVTNNDNAFCSSTTFTIANGSETGNTASFVLPSVLGSASTGALAPGASYNTTLMVKAQAAAAIGDSLTSLVNVSGAGHTTQSASATTTVAASWANSGLLHNSTNTSSTKWGGNGWGIPNGKYGPIACDTCHIKNSANIKRIRTSITAPLGNWSSSGTASVTVSFLNLTSMGNDANNHNTSTRVCEACHTRNKYHNYNTSKNTGGTTHNNSTDCVGCHAHNAGFKGEESRGGKACTACHNSGKFSAGMKGTNGYHHYMQSTDSVTYGTVAQPVLTGGAADTNRNCLMCHVDHDLFRPDINLNAGSGRAKNLRADISTTPTAANTASYANTDFLPDATKNGGICLSCHRTAQTNLGYTQSDGSLRKPAIPYPDTIQKQVFVYTSSAHNYTVNSTFSGTGTNTFAANCVKCHNDTLSPKSGYNAQGNSRVKFGNHTTSIPQMLTTFGAPVTSSQKADFCFKCHGNVDPFKTTTPNINVYRTTPQFDWYSTTSMTARTKNIAADYNDATLTHKHQVQLAAYADKHHAGETRAELSANKHVTCDDCHNHHGSKKGLHVQAGSRSLSPALTGAMGVTPPTWTAWSTARAAGTTVTWADALVPATEEWQICFKCHSSYNTNLAGWVNATTGTGHFGGDDLGIELNPTYKSGHAVIGNSRVPADSPSNFAAGTPWNKNSIMTCTDCHVTNNTGVNDPKGGHASKNPFMLRGNYDPTLASMVDMANHGPAEMCGLCHNPLSYGISALDPTGTQGSSGYSAGTNNLHLEHAFRQGISGYKCSMCHAANIHGSPRQAMFVINSDPAPYKVGTGHVGSFTRKANKTYAGSSCLGGVGACSAGIHP